MSFGTGIAGIAAASGGFARRNRAPLTLGAALWSVSAAFALLLPLDTDAPELQPSILSTDSPAPVTRSEDLASFLASERWGVSLAALQREQALAAGESLMPEMQEVGFLGFAAREDRTTVLLRMPDGSVDERELGEELPDGRRLTALGDTELTVSDKNQAEEELLLFPDVTDYNEGDRDTADNAQDAELEAPP